MNNTASNLEKAKALLNSTNMTCVCCSNTDTLTSQGRGVAPLLAWYDEGRSLETYAAADKVVGNGAAFLYVLLAVKELHANVISKSALKTLHRYQIPVTYDTLTEAIRNRTNTGACPIETAVAGITAPDEALSAIRNKLKEMQQR